MSFIAMVVPMNVVECYRPHKGRQEACLQLTFTLGSAAACAPPPPPPPSPGGHPRVHDLYYNWRVL